jgi:serine O-acetyltransferase
MRPFMAELSLLQTMRADVEATVHPNYKLFGPTAFWTRVIGKVLLNPNVRAVLMFRVGHALAVRGLTPLAMYLRGRIVRNAGADIHPLATIGPGFHMVHSTGVTIGPDAVVGKNLRMHHGSTIGVAQHLGGLEWASAKIGDDVVIGAHAVLIGDVTVGDGAQIGANAVVTRDVVAGQRVVGIPAHPIGESRDAHESAGGTQKR